MKTNSNLLLCLTFFYIYIPIFAFLLGWTNILLAIITIVILCVGIWRMLKEYSRNYINDDIFISYPVIILSLLIIASLCIVVGIGGIYPQAGDWFKHNAVLRDLIKNSWPVYYTEKEEAMLTYYLGYYLVPALIGKIAGGFDAGNIAFIVWTVLGLFLVFLHLTRVIKANTVKKQLITLFVLIFFCGALNPCQNILKSVFEDEMNSLGSYHWVLVRNIMLQYRSNLVMIRWVVPQVVVTWLVTLLFYENFKKVRYYVLLLLPVMLYGTFSFAALVVMSIIYAIVLLLKHDVTFWEIASAENITSAVTLGSILFFYFWGNVSQAKPVSSSFRLESYSGMYMLVYIVFCIFMFGIYAGCVFADKKRNVLFYLNLVILLVLPWFKMGLCNDVVMSASIPSLFILMIFVLELLFDERESTKLGIRKGIAISVLVIGMWYPVKEIKDNIVLNTPGYDMGDDYKTLKWFTDRKSANISEDLCYNYYTYDLHGKVFYEYIARRKVK